MKTQIKLVVVFAMSLAALVPSSLAQLSVPSDGSDGALNITSNTVIDLSQAITGTWTAPGSGTGIYDLNQWAVVCKYSSVNIANGATVSFINHSANPPVVWLVQSNVTINGTVSVNGANGTSSSPAQFLPAVPGPGGFAGAAYDPSIGTGEGFGLGGGIGNVGSATYQSSYGNPQILHLIGGSGGSVANNCGYVVTGGSGAGAILIVAGTTVSVTGQITAIPGAALGCNGADSYGSGGGIRLVAYQISGTGSINAAPKGSTRLDANSI